MGLPCPRLLHRRGWGAWSPARSNHCAFGQMRLLQWTDGNVEIGRRRGLTLAVTVTCPSERSRRVASGAGDGQGKGGNCRGREQCRSSGRSGTSQLEWDGDNSK